MDVNNAQFPAVLIAGPPHSGKSVLIYSLTQALRQQGVAHYVFRACPDSEGDWSNEADQALVTTLRLKGAWTTEFVGQVTETIQRRQLPLLVDTGGRLTPEQEMIPAACTHAILLIADPPTQSAFGAAGSYEQERAQWHELLARNHVTVIGEIRSRLGGQDELSSSYPVVSGAITNLERGQTATGAAFFTLVSRLAQLFADAEAALAASRLPLVLELSELQDQLGGTGTWHPEQIPALLHSISPGRALAIYGRGPNWVYGALAMHAYPAPVWQFDASLGWISAPHLPIVAPTVFASHTKQPGWDVRFAEDDDKIVLNLYRHGQILDIRKVDQLPLPDIPRGKGLLISGPMPFWLNLAVARQFADSCRWIALFQPPLGGAVVIKSQESAELPVGHFIPYEEER
ncbi:MAG: hypothetical protein KDE28_21415 [Anaerolineales bacterium]|nr:hypothetical protein [Anaerolineales bacterium]